MIDPERALLRSYQTRFPARLNLEILNWARMADGLASDVYGCTVCYEEDGQSHSDAVIVKSYPRGHAPHLAAQTASAEFNTMRLLHTAGYPVPRVLLLETDPEPFGRPFMIMERVPGRPLWDVLRSATAERAADLTRLFCQLFVDLHALDYLPFLPDPALPELYDDTSSIRREIHTLRQMALDANRTTFLPVIDWLQGQETSIRGGRMALIHRDYHPWNVLLAEDGRAYVIDWNAEVSDFRFDLAWTLDLMRRAGFADFAQAALDGYQQIVGEPVLDLDTFAVAANIRWMMIVLNSLQSGTALRSDAAGSFRQLITPMINNACALIEDHTGIAIPPPLG